MAEERLMVVVVVVVAVVLMVFIVPGYQYGWAVVVVGMVIGIYKYSLLNNSVTYKKDKVNPHCFIICPYKQFLFDDEC
ncbi:hypothetical protein E2C01_093835 [Portunus trituberculatus]|uniref:Uncharacterized protein n=1 Tax=Portunus trituberculatus TaxID=210409 RepID=A0A5B7K1G3_PORTR|nr:hypothetical protein [Portunus trituberculatus]